MNEVRMARRRRGGARPQALEQRLELLRLRGAGLRLELALARQEAGERIAGLRRGWAMLSAIVQTLLPRRWRKQWANLPLLRWPTILGPVLVPLLIRPLWRWLSGARRRRSEVAADRDDA
jgi:hypothetical protein